MVNQAGENLDFSPTSHDGRRQLDTLKDQGSVPAATGAMLKQSYSESWITPWVDRITDLGPAPKYSGDPAEKIGFHDALERGYLVRPDDFNGGLLSLSRVWLLDERHRISGGFQDKLDQVQDGPLKTLTHFGLDLATDPLTWVPGAAYGKALEKIKYAGDLGTAAAKNSWRSLRGLEIEQSAAQYATKRMNEARVAYTLDGQTLDQVSFTSWRNGPALVLTTNDGSKARLLLSRPEEKALVKQLGGDQVAKYIDQSTRISVDMPGEMKTMLTGRIQAMKADPTLSRRLDELARELKVEVDDLPGAIGDVMDKTVISLRNEAGQMIDKTYTGFNPRANGLLAQEFSKNSKLFGLEVKYMGKNNRLKYAHAETMSVHKMGKEYEAMGRLDDLKGGTLRKVVHGRNVCPDCLKNIALQARELGLANVLLFEQKTGKMLFWSSGMTKDIMVPLGQLDRSFDAATITSKVSAVGGNQGNNIYTHNNNNIYPVENNR